MNTYSLHCSSFLGLPFRILNTKVVKPKEGTTMETLGMTQLLLSGGSIQGLGLQGALGLLGAQGLRSCPVQVFSPHGEVL